MAATKRSSNVLAKAQLRASGLKAIDSNIDFGNNNSLQNMIQQIEQLSAKLDTHNTALAMIDASRTDIEQLEKNLSTLCEKMLLAVAAKYGKDSNEYEMAGGVRKSDRIRKGTATRLKSVPQEIASDTKYSVKSVKV
jgi:ABC-type hemin transport system substrate-binding protein